jgi:WhiB family redox-sensing transcriptional regulator
VLLQTPVTGGPAGYRGCTARVRSLFMRRPARSSRSLIMLSSDAVTGPFGWMSRGACQREDPELFFPVTTHGAALRQVNAAKAVCRACAVRAACLSFGLQTSQDGIWGGTTPEERRCAPAHRTGHGLNPGNTRGGGHADVNSRSRVRPRGQQLQRPERASRICRLL